jgi:hypothetical protein
MSTLALLCFVVTYRVVVALEFFPIWPSYSFLDFSTVVHQACLSHRFSQPATFGKA